MTHASDSATQTAPEPEARSDVRRQTQFSIVVPVYFNALNLPDTIPQLLALDGQADGMRVEWHAYPMAHQVCAEEIRDLGDWLSAPVVVSLWRFEPSRLTA